MPTWCCSTVSATTKSTANGANDAYATHRYGPRTEGADGGIEILVGHSLPPGALGPGDSPSPPGPQPSRNRRPASLLSAASFRSAAAPRASPGDDRTVPRRRRGCHRSLACSRPARACRLRSTGKSRSAPAFSLEETPACGWGFFPRFALSQSLPGYRRLTPVAPTVPALVPVGSSKLSGACSDAL
jgi:hypothetical protein